MYKWSPKQLDVVTELVHGTEKQTLLSGPTQSGKSLAAVFGFFGFSTRWSGTDFIISSRSKKQLDGVVVKYARQFCDSFGLEWRKTLDDGYVMSGLEGRAPNRFFPLFGGDAGSEASARSFTVGAALIEEATTVNPDFISMVSSRCSLPGAKMVLTTNPDAPSHPLKTEWIDNPEVKTWEFDLYDNPILDKDYEQMLLNNYTGHMRERMVYGKWVSATGSIYPNVRVSEPPDGEADLYVLGADWADSGSTHVVLVGYYNGVWYCEAEWEWTGSERGELDELQKSALIKRDLVTNKAIRYAFADPSRPSFKKALELTLNGHINESSKTKNDVAKGIEYVRKSFDSHNLFISRDCPILLQQLYQYVWDERAALIGEDKPKKHFDHGCDALRYAVFNGARMMLRGDRSSAKIVRTR